MAETTETTETTDTYTLSNSDWVDNSTALYNAFTKSSAREIGKYILLVIGIIGE